MSRRLVLVLLMLVLPLQWSWAVAASVCAHEEQVAVAHPGHHEHHHDGAHDGASKGDDGSAGKSLGEHPDCGTCHGPGSAFLGEAASHARPCAANARFTRYASPVPERTLEALFRPPLLLVG